VALDFVEGVRYNRLVAEQGHAGAQLTLGFCYANGDGVAKDWAEAVRYCRLAKAQAGALSAVQLAAISAACHLIACSREVAVACCLGCGARRRLKTCAKCHVARFCSIECVLRAWPAHKPKFL
jgi:hypothetical protein